MTALYHSKMCMAEKNNKEKHKPETKEAIHEICAKEATKLCGWHRGRQARCSC
jgi:hypothetical protein